MRCLLFHKPYDVVTQFSDREQTGRATLADFIPVKGVYPVGRLDRDSEGLLLLTDDGALQHRLTDPRFHHPKTYWAQVEGIPGPDAIGRLRSGGILIQQEYRTRPAEARLLDPPPDIAPRVPPIRYRASIPDSWIELTLTEGRNRQVRRMTAAIGFPTLRLIRVAIGDLRLEGLEPGQWRELTAAERQALASIGQRVRPPAKAARARPSRGAAR